MFRLKFHVLPKLKKQSWQLVTIIFILTFAYALMLPVYPLFIKTFLLKDAYVGYFTAFFSIELLVLTLMQSYYLNRFNKIFLLKVAVIGMALSYAILPFINKFYQLLFIQTLNTFFLSIVFTVSGLLLRNLTNKRNIGKLEGLSFTLFNLAYLIGPFVGGFLAEKFSISLTFVLAANIMTIALLFLIIGGYKDKFVIDVSNKNLLSYVKSFFQDKRLRGLYVISMGLVFWWVILYTYVPLYLSSLNITKTFIGLTMALYVVPLLLVETIAGALADNYGYKKFMVLGIFVISLFLFIATLFSNINLFVLFLVIACFGAALVEPLREAYFFKLTKKSDETRLYPLYKTSLELSYLVSPLILSSLLIVNNNYKMMFIIGAIIILIVGIVYNSQNKKNGY